ncbi:MAG: OsmC family protein [Usitatibacter sp.]
MSPGVVAVLRALRPDDQRVRHQTELSVSTRRVDAHGSVAHCKDATLTLDTDMAGRRDAFNPAELLLAALSACIVKGIERVTPLLKFKLRGLTVRVHGVRQDAPPKMESII